MDVGVNVLIMVLMMHMAFVFGSTPKRHFIKKGRKKKMVQKEEDKRSAKRNKMQDQKHSMTKIKILEIGGISNYKSHTALQSLKLK